MFKELEINSFMEKNRALSADDKMEFVKETRGCEAPGEEDLRLVFIGKTGAGKSATANTILGRTQFLSQASFSSVTKECQVGAAEVTLDTDPDKAEGRRKRRVLVIDMPGYGDTRVGAEQIHAETAKCVSLAAPGPHAFLLVVPIGRYTESDHQAACELAKIFGEDAVRHHTVVLFTGGDNLNGRKIDECLSEAPPGLKSLIDRCGGRYHVFNNNDSTNPLQVKELLVTVDDMVKHTKEGFYTNAMFVEAEALIRKEQRRKLRKLRKKRRMLKETGEADGSECSDTTDRRGPSKQRQRDRGCSQQPSKNSWLEAALSPEVLKKIKVLVAALAVGLAVGVVAGALVPLAFAGGASVITGAALGAAASWKAIGVGAAIGGMAGGLAGAVVGGEAESPGDGARQALKQVGFIGAGAVGLAAAGGLGYGCVGLLKGAGAAPAVSAGVANVIRAQSDLPSVLAKAAASGVAVTATGGVALKMGNKKFSQCTGEQEISYSEKTYEFQWNPK